MKIQDLKKLMGSLSLHEKIGQLVQLDGGFFGAEEVPTGPCDEMGIAPWVVENAGSVLNVLGVNKVQEFPHRACIGWQLGYGAGGGMCKKYRL